MGSLFHHRRDRPGMVFDGLIFDTASVAPDFRKTVKEFLQAGSEAGAIFATLPDGDGEAIPLDGVTPHAPTPRNQQPGGQPISFAERGL